MTFSSRAWLVAAFFAIIPAYRSRAQARPTPEQAQQLLQNASAATIARIQSELRASGLTDDQIRARLQAEGYPSTLLDAYLPGAPASDSTMAKPGADVFAAMRKLGMPLDSLQSDTGYVRPTARPLVRAAISSTAAVSDSGTTLFGSDMFTRHTNQFDPVLSGPMPSDYRIGPGDELVLILTGDVEQAYTLPISREGFVVIPNVGQISVANLTLDQLTDLLYSRLGRSYSGVRRGADATTHFSVSISRLGTNQVTVLGDVVSPGTFRISKLGTVLTALYAAEGPSATGNWRDIQVRRAGRIVAHMDLYDYLLSASTDGDPHLESGDIVFVPPRGSRVRLAGPVVRPATYELKPGETLGSLIRMAGGFRAEADRRRLQIERILPPDQRTAEGKDRVLFDVSSASLETSTEPLHAGDVVHVLAVAGHVANRIVVDGNVWTAGPVAFTAGMHLSDALRRAGGIKPDTYLGALQISRLKSDSTRQIISVGLRDSSGAVTNDLQLQPDDEIRVFATTEYRTKRYISVTGAVRNPGRIEYRDGMTLRQALMLVGGVTEGASLTEAEVAHMPESHANGLLAKSERVSLDSSYVFDGSGEGQYPGGVFAQSKLPEIPLRPYDNVLILKQPDWTMPRTVTITGEVKYPGQYTLTTRDERLDHLIERAGGLTKDGYAAGAVFTRRHGKLGRVGIDLEAAMRDPSSSDNLVLADSDEINVPQFMPFVSITGAVNNPVAVAYVQGAPMDYYVASAGGLALHADPGRGYVLQPGGKLESRRSHMHLWTSSPTPLPGSTIVIPTKDPNEKHDWLAIATASTSILGSLVAIAAIVKR
jgi:protein involved in polysaccharide export with SLBB domain